MKIGTKSVLFGAHQFLIHPWFVALGWWKLYGFPFDPRLWVLFFTHDIGYIGKPNMDGPEGERHVELGARIMHGLFDWPRNTIESPCRYCGRTWKGQGGAYFGPGCSAADGCCTPANTRWYDLSVYHSRFYSKRDGVRPSKLCAADKLAVALEPWWLYLPRVILTGEINEYMAKAGGMPGSKYNGEPETEKYKSMNLVNNSAESTLWQRRRFWFSRMTEYLRAWANEHKDGREDMWTPSQRTSMDNSGVWK